MSGTLVTATVGNTARTLGDWVSDAIFIEGFGAKGDGTTDDSSALVAAIASGKPVRFGPKVYIINSNITITTNIVMVGCPGETIIRRTSQTVNESWFIIGASGTNGTTISFEGIIFDANSSVNLYDQPTISVGNYCSSSYWGRCSFINNQGTNSGHGLSIGNSPATGTLSRHIVIDCDATANCHGIYGQAIDGFQVISCRSFNNRNGGIVFSYYDVAKQLKGRYAQIISNRCWGNVNGIAVGDFFQDGSYDYGPANADTLLCLISDNQCYSNTQYGIVAQGQFLQINGNTCTLNGNSSHGYGAGILANSSNTQIIGNTIVGDTTFGPSNLPHGYGIDAGGASDIFIASNNISFYQFGIDVGGCQNAVVTNNYIFNCMGQSIFIDAIEASLGGISFPNPTNDIELSNNIIIIPTEFNGLIFYGILINNGAQNIAISRNKIFVNYGDGSNCLLANTDTYSLTANCINGQRVIKSYYSVSSIGGYQTLRYLDIVDTIILSSGGSSIQSIRSMNEATYSSAITFIKVTAGGSGYTSAPTIAIAGSGGASASAFVSGGVLLGIRMTNQGTGYNVASPPAVSFSGGGGGGAAATAYVGLLPPTNRQLKIICSYAASFPTTGSYPLQTNYTGSTITCPVGTSIDWIFQNGGWTACKFL